MIPLLRKGTIPVAIAVVFFGLIRGLHEGMIMHSEGVRAHVAFYMYHVVSIFVIIALWVLFASLLGGGWWTKKDGIFPYVLLISGLVIINWECFEIAYTIARTDIPRFSHEHIVFADIISFNISGWQVWALHYLRVAIGTIFLITGSMNDETPEPV